ncbi:hypothetical protein MIR68_000153 [Amoeboaphelidium protococcarum]|nr:hypothetical protein MIR68_000153 [Amoeboaphelidium protococcarum]
MDDLSINSLFSVKDKVALVSGGSRGIGFMFASALVQNGAKVYIVSRKEKDVRSAADQLNSSRPGACVAVDADLSRMDGIMKVVSFVSQRETSLDILVNNAGANWAQDVEKFTETAFDKVLNLNLKSVFFLTQKLLPLLKASGDKNASDPARIVNVGSINGLMPPQFPTYAYSASKAAVAMLSKHLAIHLSHLNPSADHQNATSSYNITVNTIAPGSFPSKMMAHTLQAFGEEIKRSVPMNRVGTSADMAATLLWLCGPGGSYVTGATIVVDGGASIVPSLLTQQSKL